MVIEGLNNGVGFGRLIITVWPLFWLLGLGVYIVIGTYQG